jgi:hypothetical protein
MNPTQTPRFVAPIVVGYRGEERKASEKTIDVGEPFPVEVGAGERVRQRPATKTTVAPTQFPRTSIHRSAWKGSAC